MDSNTVKNKVALITSYHWEGAYIMKQFIDARIGCADILLQKSWWREKNFFGYSEEYLKLMEFNKHEMDRRYYNIEELAKEYDLSVHHIDNINDVSTHLLLDNIQPQIIVIAGSKIIKEDLIKTFDRRIINFHTGLLPRYRGPYSEFWAYYNESLSDIGTTIHLIDRGIDTGDILNTVTVDPTLHKNPQEAHVINAKLGAKLLSLTILPYLSNKIVAIPQDEKIAHYYTYPSDTEINHLRKKLGKDFNIFYAD
jgi:methionyl-tRNA formyltransferase